MNYKTKKNKNNQNMVDFNNIKITSTDQVINNFPIISCLKINVFAKIEEK